MLELHNINKAVAGECHADDISLSLEAGEINLLLGRTLAGKTSLLRLIAGLDQPDSGTLLLDREDLSRVPLRKRNIAMVYQQFINYPSLSVYENIASPLQVAGMSRTDIKARVEEAAALLQISPYLDRLPGELSGGQQQRVALARALVKRARIVLLDEPLANLDYKLREELRAELPEYFHRHGAILVYATTEPEEALQLGGKTAVMHEGRVIQFGPTAAVYRSPSSLQSASIFSDPPINTSPATLQSGRLSLTGTEVSLGATASALPDGNYTIGFRAHSLKPASGGSGLLNLRGRVEVSEVTGAESYVHLQINDQRWISLTHDVRTPEPGAEYPVSVDPADFYFFDSEGALALSPATRAH